MDVIYYQHWMKHRFKAEINVKDLIRVQHWMKHRFKAEINVIFYVFFPCPKYMLVLLSFLFL